MNILSTCQAEHHVPAVPTEVIRRHQASGVMTQEVVYSCSCWELNLGWPLRRTARSQPQSHSSCSPNRFLLIKTHILNIITNNFYYHPCLSVCVVTWMIASVCVCAITNTWKWKITSGFSSCLLLCLRKDLLLCDAYTRKARLWDFRSTLSSAFHLGEVTGEPEANCCPCP